MAMIQTSCYLCAYGDGCDYGDDNGDGDDGGGGNNEKTVLLMIIYS